MQPVAYRDEGGVGANVYPSLSALYQRQYSEGDDILGHTSMSAAGTPSPQLVTQLLIEWGNGNQAALEQLMPLVYGELHRMAKRHMGQQKPNHTLQTTALIHEAYMKLAGDAGRKNWESRGHFFGVAATVMRHILVDYARAAGSAKRGGARPLPLDEAAVVSSQRLAGMVALDDALIVLAKLHPRQSKVVELRYFGGLNIEETAAILNVSTQTVMRDWRAAKAWLGQELGLVQSGGEQADDT